MPSNISPVVTRRQSAMSSLRANATIIVLRAPAPVGRSGLKPLRQGVAVLEPQKTPRQSDHAGADASATGACQTLFTPAYAALIWEPVRPA